METKSVPVSGFEVLDDEKGIVEAVVSVTGVIDKVKDNILPGAYEKTLRERKPKGIWSHDWKLPISKTLSIEEPHPGDPRLPQKIKAVGGGGLLVKTQFNLDTQRGRDAYSDVKFYGEEASWSIGYNVPRGGARNKAIGTAGESVREIKTLDLYEYSPVLFGAHPLATTVSVKSLVEDAIEEGYLHADELKSWEELIETNEIDDVLDLDDKGLHDILSQLTEAELDALCDGEAVEAEIEVEGKGGEPNSPTGRYKARHLIRWYERGEGAAKIRWGHEGDWKRCVRIASKYMTPARAKGFCQLRHKGATGHYAGKGPHVGARKSEESEGMYLGISEVDETKEIDAVCPHCAGDVVKKKCQTCGYELSEEKQVAENEAVEDEDEVTEVLWEVEELEDKSWAIVDCETDEVVAEFATEEKAEEFADLLYEEYDALEPEDDLEDKRQFSSEKRRKAAKEGAALSDGSFPIENTEDLRNAIKAVGRAKNPARARAHIVKRAKALGAEGLLPDGWDEEKSLNDDLEAKVEILTEIVELLLEEKGLGDRIIRTAEGARRYGKPIGSRLGDGDVPLGKGRAKRSARARTVKRPKPNAVPRPTPIDERRLQKAGIDNEEDMRYAASVGNPLGHFALADRGKKMRDQHKLTDAERAEVEARIEAYKASQTSSGIGKPQSRSSHRGEEARLAATNDPPAHLRDAAANPYGKDSDPPEGAPKDVDDEGDEADYYDEDEEDMVNAAIKFSDPKARDAGWGDAYKAAMEEAISSVTEKIEEAEDGDNVKLPGEDGTLELWKRRGRWFLRDSEDDDEGGAAHPDEVTDMVEKILKKQNSKSLEESVELTTDELELFAQVKSVVGE